jgi:phospholipid/cholesterol/gamma-HCH transport system ATP-binding protein
MIEIRSLKKNLGGNQVLDGVDLMVDEGECVVVMGPSGTGKSVLLKHIVGLFDPDEGDVLVDGVSVSRADGRTIKRIRSRISYVFQNSALFDSLTVEGNILLGLPEGHCKRPDVDCHELVREALEHVNLGPGVLPLLPAELSGGMQKRVALARAVVGRQPYILYDARLKSEIGSTSVIVTHDVDSAFFLADRIAVLSDGVIQAVGTPEELRTTPNPRVQRFLDPAAYAGAM